MILRGVPPFYLSLCLHEFDLFPIISLAGFQRRMSSEKRDYFRTLVNIYFPSSHYLNKYLLHDRYIYCKKCLYSSMMCHVLEITSPG